jgi:hypothetical protein
MNIQDKLRQLTGIKYFLSFYELDFNLDSEKSLNNLFVEYGKEFKMTEVLPNNNKKYKGKFNPVIQNASHIQDNFKQFRSWVKNKYVKIDLSTEFKTVVSIKN